MKIKILTALFIIMICPCVYADNAPEIAHMTTVVQEDFSTMNGTRPLSSDWVIDFKTGADVMEGLLRVPGKDDKMSSASFEIPSDLIKYFSESDFMITVKIKAEGERGNGIICVTDKYGNALGGALLSDNGAGMFGSDTDPDLHLYDWNEVVMMFSPSNRTYSLFINGTPVGEACDFYSNDSKKAEVVRFAAMGNFVLSISGMTIETADEYAEPAANISFYDVSPNNWARKYILELAGKGIMIGTEEGYFSPDENITYAQAAVILCRIFGVDTEPGDEWYSGAVKKFEDEGISYNISWFDSITRKDLCLWSAKMLKNTDKYSDNSIIEGQFADINELTDEEILSILTLASVGVIDGVSDTEFEPYNNATREQAAKIFYKLKLLADP